MNTTEDDDFSESVLPPEVAPLASPEPLKFQPWHKPRKQYVRVEQWLRHVEGIVGKLGLQSFTDGEPLRYMTLGLSQLRVLKLRFPTNPCVSSPELNFGDFGVMHQ